MTCCVLYFIFILEEIMVYHALDLTVVIRPFTQEYLWGMQRKCGNKDNMRKACGSKVEGIKHNFKESKFKCGQPEYLKVH